MISADEMSSGGATGSVSAIKAEHHEKKKIKNLREVRDRKISLSKS